MRTTVTLDPDVERLLKDEAHRTRRSFKVVLNDAVRETLKPVSTARPLLLPPVSMGEFLIDPRKLGEFLDDMEMDAHVETTRRLREPK